MASATDDQVYALSEAQKAHFLEHGFVKIEKCFTRAQAADFTADLWVRLGMSPTDKATWTAERTNMPWHRKVVVSEFAPKAWAAMCELLGGPDRMSDVFEGWGDGFIVNLGKPEYKADDELDLRRDMWGWHNDGDFFVHFLDSPQQALLVIPLWSDIVPVMLSLLLLLFLTSWWNFLFCALPVVELSADITQKGGGTVICTDGMKHIAKHLVSTPPPGADYVLIERSTNIRKECLHG